jgi:nucleotide-binding universal stress UspA family protein
MLLAITAVSARGGGHMQTIVVGFDEKPESERALERAIELARAFGSKLVVTSVAPIAASVARGGAVDPADSPRKHRDELREARNLVEGQGMTAEYVAAVGDPADSIVDVADGHHADLIVVEARALGFVERLLGQSTSGGVARRAHTDVLIVRSHDE